MSNEENPGCLGYIGDYTTQLCGHYHKPLYKDPYQTTRIQWKVRLFFFRVSNGRFFYAQISFRGFFIVQPGCKRRKERGSLLRPALGLLSFIQYKVLGDHLPTTQI